MKKHLYKKIYVITALLVSLTLYNIISNKTYRRKSKFSKNKKKERGDVLKYILLWKNNDVPFGENNEGQYMFRHCPHQNCYVTKDRNYLTDYTMFDAIVFAQRDLVRSYDDELPIKRSPHQKFVFASFKPAETDYPVCSKLMDGFFNWTWTYRLDSEIRSNPVVIKDVEGNIIGPSKVMHWIKPKDMKPVNEDMKDFFKNKSQIVLRVVSNCETLSRSLEFTSELELEIKKYNQKLQAMFYDCKDYQCSYDRTPCEDVIKENYLFFLSFEISFDEDFVTDRLLYAVQNRAIPIVYGAANYSRFLPDGAYINAREFTPEELTKKIMNLTTDLDKYSEYFKWTNHYKYERAGDTAESNQYCRLCQLLNDNGTEHNKVYNRFREWWNPPNYVCA